MVLDQEPADKNLHYSAEISSGAFKKLNSHFIGCRRKGQQLPVGSANVKGSSTTLQAAYLKTKTKKAMKEG